MKQLLKISDLLFNKGQIEGLPTNPRIIKEKYELIANLNDEQRGIVLTFTAEQASSCLDGFSWNA